MKRILLSNDTTPPIERTKYPRHTQKKSTFPPIIMEKNSNDNNYSASTLKMN